MVKYKFGDNYYPKDVLKEMKDIFDDIERLTKHVEANIKPTSAHEEHLETLEIAIALQRKMNKFKRARDKEYWDIEETRPRTESEIESERYNHPG